MIFHAVKFRMDLHAEEARIKTTTSPQIRCRTTLQKVSVQLRSFTAHLLQFKAMQKV